MLALSDPPSLHTLNGTLEHCGERVCVDGSVDFGPVWYVATAQARDDYDGDEVIGSLAEEVAGLIGQKVTFETDGGSLDQDVLTVNGMRLRDPDGELPAPEEPSRGALTR